MKYIFFCVKQMNIYWVYFTGSCFYFINEILSVDNFSVFVSIFFHSLAVLVHGPEAHTHA